MPPERSAGTNRLVLELGRGGMGVVYLALAERPGGFRKLKVLKTLRRDLAGDLQFLQMFLEEARLAARLNHPNIVQTNEVGFDGRDYFIEMEYLDGQPFDAILRRAGKSGGFPLPYGLWVLSQSLAGLHHAHELREIDGTPLRVVHRDVSPQNIFVTYDGAVKVVDFGIAKAADGVVETRTGVVRGKVRYMAPEQATRGPLDRRVDVFAVGTLLWQIASGKRIWDEMEDVEVLLKLQQGEVPRVREANPAVPEALARICDKAMATGPDERYATAADFQTALENYLDQTGAKVGPRPVGAFLAELFAERRAAVQAEIEEQVAAMAARPPGSVHVPSLGATGAFLATATDASKSDGAEDAEQATRAEGSRGSGVKTAPAAPGAATGGGSLDADRIESPVARLPGGEAEEAEVSRTAGALERGVTPVGLRAQRKRWLAAAAAGGLALLVAAGLALRIGVDRDRASGRSPGWVPGTAGNPAAQAQPVCAKNADCLAKHANSLCRHGQCVALETSECRALAEPGQAENDETIRIGGMFPQQGPRAEAGGLAAMQTLDLVRREIVQFAGGLPRLDGTGGKRPFALLACDDSSDATRAAVHLAKDVEVPAVVGFRSSQEAVDLATTVFLPRRTLMIVADDVGASVTSVPEPSGVSRLVWRTTYNARASADPMALLVSEVLEPALRAQHVDAVRVAFLRTTTTAAISLSDALSDVLRVDGAPVARSGSAYRELGFGDSFGNATAEDYSRGIREVLDFKPHVVLFSGSETDADALILGIEKEWPATVRIRPRYVFQDAISGDKLMDHPSNDLRRRLYGVTVSSQRAANDKYTAHFNEVFATHMSPRSSFAAIYDAGYLAAYAAYAAKPPIGGDSLAQAITRLLPPARPIDVGPTHIFDVLAAIQNSGRVDLNGAASNLDFDVESGETQIDFSIVCLGMDLTNQESGLTYSRAQNRLVGTWECK